MLSVLETAAPSSFISNIINDPAYASSFESAFSAGSSPSWFTALPTDVKSYLHTYTGFVGIASAAAGIQSDAANATTAAGNDTASSTGAAHASGASMTTSTSGASSGSGMMSTTSSSGNPASTGSSSASAAKATTGGATRPTGVIAAGFVGAAGVLGLAIAL